MRSPLHASSCATTAGHLDRRDRRFPSFVGRAVARALERFFDRIRRQHAERHRHAGRRRGGRQAVRDGRRDELEVRRLAADQTAEADDGVERAASPPRAARRIGISNAPGTRTTVTSSAPTPAAASAASAPACSRSVTKSLILRHDDGEPESGRLPIPSPSIACRAPPTVTSLVNAGLRFSRNARGALAHVVGRRDEAEERRLVRARLGERHLERRD